MSTIVVCVQCRQGYAMQPGLTSLPRCPACQGELRPHVPNAPAASLDPFALAPLNTYGSAQLKPAAPAPRSSEFPVALLAVGGIGLFALLLACGGFAFYFSRSKAPQNPVAMQPNPVVPLPTFPLPQTNSGGISSIPVNPNSQAPPTVPSPFTPPKNSPPESSSNTNATGSTAGTSGSKAGTLKAPGKNSSFGSESDPHADKFTERVSWNVQPDPSQEVYEYPPVEKMIDIDFKTRVDKLLFPNRPSPYFAAVSEQFRNKEIRIFDLRTGRSSRKFPGELNREASLSALSFDGEQIATVPQHGDEKGIVIADTKKGNVIQTITLEEDSKVVDIAFAGPGQLLAVVESRARDDERFRIGIWDLHSEKSIADLKLTSPVKKRFGSSDYKEKSLAVSPGGKYFACVMDTALSFYFTANGKLAGEIQIPELEQYGNPSMAFSPDGKEISIAIGNRAQDMTIVRIDLSNGDSIGSCKVHLEQQNSYYSHQNLGRLQYLPALGAYLVEGAFVVEQSTGEGLYFIEVFGGMARVVDGTRVVGVLRRGDAAAFSQFRLPTAEIERLASVLKGGGELLDALWGPATTGTLSSATTLRPPLQTQPVSFNLAAIPEPAKAKRSLSLPTSSETKYQWEYDPPLFSLSSNKIAWLPHCDRANSRLFVVDVASGSLEGDLDMPPGTRALDISPDGTLVLAGLGRKRNYADVTYERLEVFSIPQKKHVFAIRMERIVEAKGGNSDREDPNLFTDAAFIDKNLILTRSGSGRLALWKLPEAKAQWVLEDKVEIVGFSPDRSLVQLYNTHRQRMSWLEVRTGEWKGDISIEQAKPENVAVSPSGKQLALLEPHSGCSRLTVRQLGEEGEGKTYILPAIGSPLRWIDDQYLLASSQNLVIDAQVGAVIWKIDIGGKLYQAPDRSIWLDDQNRKTNTLSKVSFPSDKLRTKLKTARRSKIEPLVGPGAHVALYGGFPNDAEGQADLVEQLEKRKWKLDPAGPFRISASTTQEPSKSVEYRGMLNNERTTVNVQGATVLTMTLANASGKELWSTQLRSGGGYAPSTLYTRDGQDLQSQVNRYNNTLRPSLGILPEYIFARDVFSGLGSSRLSEKGDEF